MHQTYWLRNIQFSFIIQVSFLLKKVLFSRYTFQALIKQAITEFALKISVSDIVAADQDNSVSVPFSTTNSAKIVTPVSK